MDWDLDKGNDNALPANHLDNVDEDLNLN